MLIAKDGGTFGASARLGAAPARAKALYRSCNGTIAGALTAAALYCFSLFFHRLEMVWADCTFRMCWHCALAVLAPPAIGNTGAERMPRAPFDRFNEKVPQ